MCCVSSDAELDQHGDDGSGDWTPPFFILCVTMGELVGSVDAELAVAGVGEGSLSSDEEDTNPYDGALAAGAFVESVYGPYDDCWVVPLSQPEESMSLLKSRLFMRHWMTRRPVCQELRSRSRSPRPAAGAADVWGFSESDVEEGSGGGGGDASSSSCSSNDGKSTLTSDLEKLLSDSEVAKVEGVGRSDVERDSVVEGVEPVAESNGGVWQMSDSDDDEVAAAAAPVAESNGGVWQMTDSSDGEVAVAEVNGNDDPSSSSESSSSESESNSSDSSGLGLGAAGHPAAGVGCVPAPGSAVELLPVDQLPSPAPQSLPSPPSTPSVQVPQPKIMALPYLLPGAAPGTFRRLCQPLLAKEVFWGDRIWQVLRGSSHPLKLLQPPQLPRWEMQCAGTGGELLGFEAFIIHTIYVV